MIKLPLSGAAVMAIFVPSRTVTCWPKAAAGAMVKAIHVKTFLTPHLTLES
jgi:hypothetical protein